MNDYNITLYTVESFKVKQLKEVENQNEWHYFTTLMTRDYDYILFATS